MILRAFLRGPMYKNDIESFFKGTYVWHESTSHGKNLLCFSYPTLYLELNKGQKIKNFSNKTPSDATNPWYYPTQKVNIFELKTLVQVFLLIPQKLDWFQMMITNGRLDALINYLGRLIEFGVADLVKSKIYCT